jgi:hypothetical protein
MAGANMSGDYIFLTGSFFGGGGERWSNMIGKEPSISEMDVFHLFVIINFRSLVALGDLCMTAMANFCKATVQYLRRNSSACMNLKLC